MVALIFFRNKEAIKLPSPEAQGMFWDLQPLTDLRYGQELSLHVQPPIPEKVSESLTGTLSLTSGFARLVPAF